VYRGDVSDGIGRKCPNCGSLNTIRIYWALVGEKKERRQVLRCTSCNTGVVLP